MHPRPIYLMVLLLLVSTLSAGPVLAQSLESGREQTVWVASAAGQGPTDHAELEAFMDRLFAESR